jgi:Holliday junction DNA helicase RuvA
MIAGLRGLLHGKLHDALLIDCGGVIYRVGTSTSSLTEAGDSGDEIQVHTYLLVREDQLALYGFIGRDELLIFETMIGVTGVGPRLACAVLSVFTPGALVAAIEAGDADLLATVPGVGKKTAARLIVELRGKLPESGGVVAAPAPGDADVVAALRSLGYTTAEANRAIAASGALGAATVEERVVAALRELSE